MQRSAVLILGVIVAAGATAALLVCLFVVWVRS